MAHPPERTTTALLTGRPEPIVWSCLLTWVFSGVAAVGLLLSGLFVATDGTQLVADARAQTPELVDSGISDRTLLIGVLVVMLGLLVWAVAAIVLAVLVWRGRDWARITLAVSAGLAGGIGLLSLLGGQLYAVPLVVGCVAALRLLLSKRAVAWCRQRPARLKP